MNSLIETLNHWGEIFLRVAGPMLWQSGLLIVVVLAFEFLLRRQLRSSIRYALWLVVLVKLILPPTLALPTSPAWWFHNPPPPLEVKVATKKFTVTYDQSPLPEMPQTPLPVFVPPKPALTLAAALLLCSVFISAALFVWLLLRWWQITRQVRHAVVSERLTILAEEVQSHADMKFKSPPVKLTTDSLSPAVCGLFHSTILIPQSLAAGFSDEQLRAVLLHELIHLRRRDVWVNFLQSLLQIVYWWHPLVWMANARIRRVREEAVDDAVMLALGGTAEIYAPTLLEVAKLALNRPLASLGLVGILESRSALRQRIERLIHFNAPRQAGLTLVSFLGILVFSAVAVPMGEGPSPVVVNISSAPAISMSATDSVTANLYPSIFASGILTNSNFLAALHALEQRTGTDTLAEPEVVTSIHPSGSVNKMDLSVLAAIQQKTSFANAASLAGGGAVAPIRDVNTNQADTSSNRLIRTYRLNYPTDEAALKKLFLAEGVQMPPTVFLYKDNGILLVSGMKDQLALVYRVVLKLNDVSPKDSEDWVNQFINEPIQKADTNLAATSLAMRTFKVDSNVFYSALRERGGMPMENATDLSLATYTSKSVADIAKSVRNFFTTLGVDLESPKGKSVFYNDGLGLLFVKATQEDLDTIDRAIQTLNQVAPQVHIKARFIEVPEKVFQAYVSELFTNAAMKSGTNGWHALLTDDKFKTVLRTLEEWPGVEELAEPEVVTTTGRQAQLRTTQIFTIITNFTLVTTATNEAIMPQSGEVETGPVFDVVPYVLADGNTINLTAIASLTDFLGYAPTNSRTVYTAKGERVDLPMIHPRFRLRQSMTHLNVWDNQTLVMQVPVTSSGQNLFPKHPAARSGFSFETDKPQKELLVFVTATIVDPAGNRVHNDDELPFAKTGFPSQPH